MNETVSISIVSPARFAPAVPIEKVVPIAAPRRRTRLRPRDRADMDQARLTALLEAVRDGTLSIDDAARSLASIGLSDVQDRG